jgi:hypothetical protein
MDAPAALWIAENGRHDLGSCFVRQHCGCGAMVYMEAKSW